MAQTQGTYVTYICATKLACRLMKLLAKLYRLALPGKPFVQSYGARHALPHIGPMERPSIEAS